MGQKIWLGEGWFPALGNLEKDFNLLSGFMTYIELSIERSRKRYGL